MSPYICFKKAGPLLHFIWTATWLLASCATPPRPPAERVSSYVTHHGRFAVRYADTQGKTRHIYGHFKWRDDGQRIILHLSNPLGQTLAEIQSEPAKASLKIPGQTMQTAQRVEDLMQNALGFALPVRKLRNWMQAAAMPGARTCRQHDAALFSASARKARGQRPYAHYSECETTQRKPVKNALKDSGSGALYIQQDGWTVHYTDAERGATPSPQYLHLKHDIPPAIEVKLILQP